MSKNYPWLAFVLSLVSGSLGCGGGSGGGSDAGRVDAARVDGGSDVDSSFDVDSGSSADAGGDARSPSDAGGDARVPPVVTPSVCADRGAEIVAATGNTISVSPAGDGQVTVDGATRSLRQVVSDASAGDTILLDDGTYTLPSASGGSYTGLYFTTANVTLRSASGDPSAVVIDSAYRSMGGESAAITVAAPGVVLANFTVKRSVFHLIHLWAAADATVVHNVRLIDAGQQFLKSSPGGSETVDGVEVGCSQFFMTAEGRDNVWGYGAQDGSTTCYTGGIDTHGARSWQVHDNSFEGIYCNADGVQRPAHGMSPDVRGGMTYTGGLSEYAIHMWDAEAGNGHVIERNRIINCARGIGLGMRTDVYDTVIKNNMVFSEHPGSREHDVGIAVERAHNTQVDNNTVIFTSGAAYGNAIEYRWDVTSGLSVRNNLTNQRIRARNGATATTSNNITDASPSWFRDAATGDLHLASCDEARVVGAGTVLPSVTLDVDAEARGSSNDIGADDCAP
ncbi:MAG: hypothetical protein GXP55_07025 [Deltaproteobacteria bacterium]|nr:hypothetical protein [Deltaproteobacteria bacterium]